MMKSVTTVLEDWLVAQGMHDRAVGAAMVMVNGGDGERSRESALNHQTAMREGGPLPMGMERDAAAKPRQFTGGGQTRFGQSRSPVLRVHVNANASHMQARKMAVSSATFLTCIVDNT
jgi:hypothetical protein